mgnify:CR=1 FL=1
MSGAANNPYGYPAAGFMPVPNWSKKILVDALKTQGGTWTAPSDGYLFLALVKRSDENTSEYMAQMYGMAIIRYKALDSVQVYTTSIVPLKKGDTITCTVSTNMYFSEYSGPYFASSKTEINTANDM